jgi:flagellar export protein FliJ
MKAFAFRLGRVLDWRSTSLKMEEAKLEPLRASLDEVRIEDQRLAQAVLNARQTTHSQHSLNGADLQALASYAVRMDEERALLADKIAVHEEAVRKQKEVVFTCDRNVRLLERLQGRRKVEWLEENNRELDSLSDDYSAASWLREQREAERRS